jgi:hypothetical protein
MNQYCLRSLACPLQVTGGQMTNRGLRKPWAAVTVRLYLTATGLSIYILNKYLLGTLQQGG